MSTPHQKNCTLPMADAGATASMVNTTQTTDNTTSANENLLAGMAASSQGMGDPRRRVDAGPLSDGPLGRTAARRHSAAAG